MTDGVVLTGRLGATTHRAVEVLAALPEELRLIGGLAVMCRVGMPHRTTVDLDAITRNLAEHNAVLVGLAVTAAGGGQYRFAHDLELDVIDVAPQDATQLWNELAALGEMTDLERNVVAHAWAHDVATPIDISVVADDDGRLLATAAGRLVASVGGLVAMKATTVPLRASARPEKRASDLYDLGRLIVTVDDLESAIVDMPLGLRHAVLDNLHAWFVHPAGRDRTYRDVRRFDEPLVDLDEVAELLEELDF